MILCNCCNKKIKVKHGRYLKTCLKCGLPACKGCMTNRYCSSCHPANADKAVITEYFREKYAEEARAAVQSVMFMVLVTVSMLLFVTITTAQSITPVSFINHSCEWINEGWTERVPVYDVEKCVYDAKNDSEVCSTELLRIDYVPHDNYVLYCEQDLLIDEKQISYELQGYECDYDDDDETTIICDSCTDGNCDGVCSANGGETCCKVENGRITCKNSVVSWEENGDALPVERLKA